MKTAEYFRKAIWDYLENKERGAQSRLAVNSGVEIKHLNDFLAGRRAMKELLRLQITNYLGVDYLDFLQHGKKLLCGEDHVGNGENSAIISLSDNHADITKKFQNQDIAIEINTDLVEIEKIDPYELEEIRDNIKSKLKKLEKRTTIKKRPAANGEE